MGIVLGIVVLVGNGWALYLSGGELSSWGVVLEPAHRSCIIKWQLHISIHCKVLRALQFWNAGPEPYNGSTGYKPGGPEKTEQSIW